MTSDSKPITESPAAEQKAESVEQVQAAVADLEAPGLMTTIRGLGGLLWGTIMAFFSDDCSSMAAALSFYTFFSLPALLTLVLTIVGRVADPVHVQKVILSQAGGLLGASGAEQVGVIIGNAHLGNTSAAVATVLSLVAVTFGATTSFAQLQTALNKAWSVKPDPRRNQLVVFLRKRIFSFGVVIMVAFLLLVSLVVGVAISLVQAATQVQEMTLSFAPKLGAIVVVLLTMGPWMIGQLVDFTRELFNLLPQLVR